MTILPSASPRPGEPGSRQPGYPPSATRLTARLGQQVGGQNIECGSGEAGRQARDGHSLEALVDQQVGDTVRIEALLTLHPTDDAHDHRCDRREHVGGLVRPEPAGLAEGLNGGWPETAQQAVQFTKAEGHRPRVGRRRGRAVENGAIVVPERLHERIGPLAAGRVREATHDHQQRRCHCAGR